jgi:hypothetical protein
MTLNHWRLLRIGCAHERRDRIGNLAAEIRNNAFVVRAMVGGLLCCEHKSSTASAAGGAA